MNPVVLNSQNPVVTNCEKDTEQAIPQGPIQEHKTSKTVNLPHTSFKFTSLKIRPPTRTVVSKVVQRGTGWMHGHPRRWVPHKHSGASALEDFAGT